MTAEKFTRWDAADYLHTREDMQGYLTACIADDPGDGRLIQAALGDIARAQNMSQLARDVGISREGLYKALSGKGNPSFATVFKVARALGLEFKISLEQRRTDDISSPDKIVLGSATPSVSDPDDVGT